MNKDFTALHAQIAALTENEPGIFAVTVIDLQSSKELNINARPMRSASLIKLFIMAEAFARMAAGSLLPSEKISFTENDIVGGAGLLQQLPAGTSRTVLELIELMITESDNIATNLLIERFGTEAINKQKKKPMILSIHEISSERWMKNHSTKCIVVFYILRFLFTIIYLFN